MASETDTGPGWLSGQRRIFAVLFVGLCLALAAGYYLFLQTDYAVLYTGVKPADASAIVAELDAKGISHRLDDNGTTILVPADQTDNVRLAVAGSDIPLKGSVGFELFNKSDMGLTDFAQKINYQRALQGEIARTIMMMEGVETARVHLAIPERSLFRTNRSVPKGAAEVIAKPGMPLTPDTVAGIQQLVASAVPELSLGEVVVIDGEGRIISQQPAPETAQSPEMEEQAAARNYYSARAKAALTGAMPGLQFGVRTLLLPIRDAAADPAPTDTTDKAASLGRMTDGARNFQLRMTVLTLAALSPDDQAVGRRAVAAAVGLDEGLGDNLSFEVGPIDTSSPTQSVLARPASAPVAGISPASAESVSATPVKGMSDWWIVALVVLAASIAIALLIRGRSPALSAAERNAFVARLRQQLGTSEDARA